MPDGKCLGRPCPSGHEVFLASRVAWVLAVPLAFLLARALGLSRAGAVAAGAVLAVTPAMAFVGRSEAATAPGIALALLSAWLLAHAGRRRDPWVLALGALALAALASHHFTGPLLAAPTALIGLAARPEPEAVAARPGWRWWGLVASALLAAALVALPQLLRALGQAGVALEPVAEAGTGLTSLLSRPRWLPTALVALGAAGLGVLAWRRPALAAGLAVFAASVTLATQASVNTWANVPRYQAPVILAVAVAVGAAVEAGLSRLGRWAALAAVPVAAWLGADLAAGVDALAVTHPEAAQLALWREALAELPAGAVLVVPARSLGESSASLPDAELAAERPDVTLVAAGRLAGAAEALGERPLFWFEPLYCHARRAEAPPVANDCDPAAAGLTLEPAGARALSVLPPAAIGAGVEPWVLVPFDAETVPCGLFRAVGRPR